MRPPATVQKRFRDKLPAHRAESRLFFSDQQRQHAATLSPAMFTLGSWSQWLIVLGVLGVSVALVYIAWWALFADRSRGRRRCPRCWYDMAYSPGMTCAECGFTARKEKQFYATRRRYGVGLGAIIAATAFALFIIDQVNQNAWPSYLPTRVLLWMLPLSGDGPSSPYAEVVMRAQSNRLSEHEMQLFIERCASGDWRMRPCDDDWIVRYGDPIDAWRDGFVGNSALEAPLFAIPPRLDVNMREIWPAGVPVTASVQVRDWWPAGMECRIRATPHLPGATPLTFYRASDTRFLRSPFALQLPVPPASTTQIVIDFEIERRRLPTDVQATSASIMPNHQSETESSAHADAEPLSWEPVFATRVTLPIRIEGELAQAAKSVDDPLMTDAMKRVFARGAVRWSGGRSPVRINVGLYATNHPQFNDTAVGVRAELLCDGVVARRLNLWWQAGRNAPNHYGFEVNYENLDLLQHANNDDGRWQLRVTGDPLLALRAGEAAQYWAGEFTVPLHVRIDNDLAPPQQWWTDDSDDEDHVSTAADVGVDVDVVEP